MAHAPVHYLRANHAERTPRHVVYADTETTERVEQNRSVLTLRLWVAQYVDREKRSAGAPFQADGHGLTADAFAAQLDTWSRGRPSLWCYFHNLGFDASALQLPMAMQRAGWRVTDCAVGGKAPWFRFGKGRKRITVCDSWSWLPYSLERVGLAVGQRKLPLPEEWDGELAWLERCRADVDALRESVCELMDWWDRNKLGNWTITGAACGWNAYRHMMGPDRSGDDADPGAVEDARRRRSARERVVIDPDPEKVRHDRRATYGGRRGVWRVGELRAGPYLELDLVAAYPTTAASWPLPRKRAVWYPELPVTDPRLLSPVLGCLGSATVSTASPRYPVRLSGVTWYPVGRFTTHLAGPDLSDAVRRAELVALRDVWVHRTGMHMADWARWCLSVQDGTHPDSPPVAQLAAKAWGRSVIGKWSSRGFDKIKLGPSPVPGWSITDGFDHEYGSRATMVDLVGTRWWVRQTEAGENSYPAVLAWVEAYVRRALSRAIEAVGAGTVVQCDTDGMIVAERTLGTAGGGGTLIAPEHLTGPARTAWVIDRLNEACAPLRWRVKRSHPHITVLGPQHLVVGGTRRWSGFPGMAELNSEGRYESRTWPRLSWQIAHGDPDGYVRPVVTQRPPVPLPTGWLLSDGRVLPPYAEDGPDGAPRLVPWFRTPYADSGLVLAANQHPALDALVW